MITLTAFEFYAGAAAFLFICAMAVRLWADFIDLFEPPR